MISESRIRRVVREELSRVVNRRVTEAATAWAVWSIRSWARHPLNEGWKGGDIELHDIDGTAVARMLRDSGETLLASLIMNHDRPGASEFIWDQILKRGRERHRSWEVDLPLEQLTYHGMSLHDMGFRNGKLTVAVGLSIGQPPINDFDEKIVRDMKVDVDFIADDRHGKRVKLGELRQGGLRSSGKQSPQPGGLADVKFASFSLQDVSLDWLDHLVARRQAAFYV